MKKNITLLIVGCSLIFLGGCGPKMIPPTDSRGVECLELIKDIKNACYAERKKEIEPCQKRNSERRKLIEQDAKLMDEKAEQSGVNKDKKLLGRLLVSLKGGLQIENCNQYAKHCDDEYKQNFISECGGRIE